MNNLFKFINFDFIKRFFIVLLLFSFFVFVSALSYVNAVSSDIQKSVFRLHVIANSDSKEDQDLKYKVRDAVITYMNNIYANLKAYLIVTVLFLIGIIAGVIFINNVNQTQFSEIQTYIQNFITALKGEYHIDSFALLKNSLLDNLKYRK